MQGFPACIAFLLGAICTVTWIQEFYAVEGATMLNLRISSLPWAREWLHPPSIGVYRLRGGGPPHSSRGVWRGELGGQRDVSRSPGWVFHRVERNQMGRGDFRRGVQKENWRGGGGRGGEQRRGGGGLGGVGGVPLEKCGARDLSRHLRDLTQGGQRKPTAGMLKDFEARAVLVMGEANMTFIDLSIIFHAYGKVGVRPGRAMVEALEAQSLSRMSNFGSQALSNTIWGYGTVGSVPGEEMLSALQNQAAAKINEFQAQHVGNTLWSFASLKLAPNAKLLDGLEKQAVVVMAEFNSQNVANTLWAFAKLGVQPGDALWSAIGERAAKIISDFNAQHVANVLWAHAVLGKALPESLLKGFEGQAAIRIYEFTPQGLANVVWALAKMGVEPGATLLNDLEKQAEGRITEYTSQHLANTMWAYATWGRLPGRVSLWKKLEAQVGERIRDPDAVAQNVANALWACATLGQSSDIGVMRRLEEQALVHLGELNAQGIANTIWSLAKLERGPCGQLWTGLEERAAVNMESFNSQNVANTVWAYSATDRRPGDELARALRHKILACSHEFSAQGVAIVLVAYAKLRLKAGDGVVEALEGQACRKIGEFDGQLMSNVLWAYAVMDLCPGKEILDLLCNRELDRMKEHQDDEELRQLHLFLFVHKLRGWGGEEGHGLVDSLRSEMGDRGRAMLAESNIAKTSKLQRDVAAAIKRLGHSFTEEYVDPASGYSIDILITPGVGDATGRQVAVEVDGPTHYLADGSHTEKGPTLLKRRVLEMAGYKILSVPYWGFQALGGNAAKENGYVGSLLSDLDSDSAAHVPHDSPRPDQPEIRAEKTRKKTTQVRRVEKGKVIKESKSGRGGSLN